MALVVLIGTLLVAADYAAKEIAGQELERRLSRAVPQAESHDARIRSVPFLLRLVTSGRVSQVDARVGGVTVNGLRFQSIRVSVHGVDLDRDEMFRNRRAVITAIDRGEVRAEVSEADLSAYVGTPIRLTEGRATVVVAGVPIPVDIDVEGGQVVVRAGPLSVTPASLLPAPLLPCAEGLRVERGRVAITCMFTDIPPELLTEAQRRAREGGASGSRS